MKLDRRSDTAGLDLREIRNLGLILFMFAVVIGAALAERAPLGHDESVYMLRARDLIERGWSSTSGTYWADYRAPGLPVALAAVARIVGLHVTSSRAIVVLLGLLTIAATWWIVRELASRVAADCAAALLALTGGFVLSSSTLLADVPGAAFSISAVAVYLADVRRGVLRSSLVLVPALTFLATATRFGAPFTIAAGLTGVSLVFLGPIIRTRNWVLMAQVVALAAATALTSALVVVTKLVAIRGETPAEANTRLVDGRGLTASAGLRDLWRVLNPLDGDNFFMWSVPVAAMFAVGLLLVLLSALLGRADRSVVLGLAVAGVASLTALVITVGQIVPNYLALTLPYWAALAGIGIAEGFEWITSRASVRPAMMTGLAIAASLVVGAAAVDNARDLRAVHQDYERSSGRVVQASLSIAERWEGNCLIATSFTPQVGYYSECRVVPTSPSTPRLDDDLAFQLRQLEQETTPPDQVGYLFVDGGKRQPTADQVAESSLLLPERYFETGEPGTGRRQYVWLQLIDYCALADVHGDDTCAQSAAQPEGG